jgi:alanine-glyoxylate transaminase/serine-glyoxylate transaminase/serine-pyruvate transaminase
MPNTSGRHFLQVPGPSNVPDRVLRAIARPTIDHRGPEFAKLSLELLQDLKSIFKTIGKVMIFPSSGTGAWEAGIVNTLSPGDKVLMFETGQFATLWKEMAVNLGLDVNFVASDWRHGADPAEVESILREDRGHAIKAVGVVHNETSSAVTNSVPAIRKAHGPCRTSRIADGGHHFVARLHGLPARRMGRGCSHRWFAKRTDAAAQDWASMP